MKRSPFALMVLIIIGVMIAVQAVLGNIVAEQLKRWLGSWADYVLPAFLVITGILIGFTARDQLARSSDADHLQALRNRRTMLDKVWKTWVKGVLQASLYRDIPPIPLTMESRPNAVRPPRTALVQRLQQAAQQLTPEISILEVFDESQGSLLILGTPGSGKTTLLLELARDLIERAGLDAMHPIPVVFPLSTWAASRQSLDQWLVEELVERYAVPRRVAQTWIADDAILPLLDGLDEVAPTAREACVDAINAFRAIRGDLPIAVCSRIADYEKLTSKFRLHAAIIVQPLNREQVRQYVRDIGFPFTPSSTSPLWDLLTTPLMLNIVTLAYVDRPEDVVRVTGSWEEMQDQMMAAYVERRLAQATPVSRYSAVKITRYLSWLAWQMRRHNQTVFYLERIQPDWLLQRPSGLRRGFRLMYQLVYGLLYRLAVVVVSGLMFGLTAGVMLGLEDGLMQGLKGGLAVGLMLGSIFALLAALQGGWWGEEKIILTDSVRWSWTTNRLWPMFWLLTVIGIGLGLGPEYGLMMGILVGLMGGLTAVEVDSRTKPNQGIHRSGQTALLVVIVIMNVVGLGSVFLGRVVLGPLLELNGGLMYGLLLGLVMGSIYGGDAWLRHYLFRLFLIQQGVMPFHYVPFLDHAAQHVLLRKVGGGYIFIHRMLLDYFAKQYKGPETTK